MPESVLSAWAKSIALKLLSFGFATLREWIAKKVYSDEELRNHIQIRGKREPEVTLSLAVSYGVPRLILKLDIENFSPYFDAALERLIGSVDGVDFTYYDGTLFRGPSPHRVFVDVALTAEQNKRLREMVETKRDATVKGMATIVASRRIVKKGFEFLARVNVST